VPGLDKTLDFLDWFLYDFFRTRFESTLNAVASRPEKLVISLSTLTKKSKV
jgi:hypothetical protein